MSNVKLSKSKKVCYGIIKIFKNENVKKLITMCRNREINELVLRCYVTFKVLNKKRIY